MSNTITKDAVTVTLPDNMLWTNEFAWAQVGQTLKISITGSPIIDAGAKQAGREILLEAGDNYGWMLRSDLLTLRGWAAIPGQMLTMVLLGVTRSVIFDHEKGPIEAEKVVDYNDVILTDKYIVKLHLIEV